MPISTFIPYEPSINSQSVTFKTHLNYIKCMARLTDGLTINIHVTANSRLNLQVFEKFEKLSNITKVSIEGEKTACDREHAYAQIASPWIPVKCYYRLYYLESVFLYLLNSSKVGFSIGGHTQIRNSIRDLLRANQISLSGTHSSDLSLLTSWNVANGFSASSGSTIRALYHITPGCCQSLRKKIAEYIEIDWKQKEKITNYRTRAAQTKRNAELFLKEFCLLDYFYWMRIKANYRDIDFLDFDNNVNEDDAYEYLKYYIKTAENYAGALTTAINLLKSSRSM